MLFYLRTFQYKTFFLQNKLCKSYLLETLLIFCRFSNHIMKHLLTNRVEPEGTLRGVSANYKYEIPRKTDSAGSPLNAIFLSDD